ncbi:hypothetical protein CHGG_04908 [Chaetomium globosum CBS 148.51]|uniref:Translation initiation factor eIF2B subunit alpha n=1 Tax=Chaetomium globosum (strain ATCC 6205 / CBS 148.51 / DSM 1962 / NBRC 6347 / NRRL 1970) TaxID=306901 RepID=Q2GZY8_CHAGB|nr:uncharacterized protein CHGG_04908 [Chaetomium globosum CBS 148.51]EAQ88289.1 hypothetical protein CHGG_04908 [Chaetomium globosum CBS 148.51]
MAADNSSQPAPASGAATQLPVRSSPTSNPTHREDGAAFDIVRTYRDLLNSDRELTMGVAAIESLIELLRETSSSTAMELVEIVKKEKAKLLASAPNPLPLLAGADLFEQYLLRSLRGPTATTTSSGRTVTKILLRAAADQSKHFKVIYIVDGHNKRSDVAVAQLREAGLEVETISPHKVAYVLGNQKQINLVLWWVTEVVMQNGGIISGMGTAQLAHLTKTVKGGIKRFYVAIDRYKMCRKTRLGVKPVVGSRSSYTCPELVDVVTDLIEVDYADQELIDGIITEQGVKMTSQIWEMVDNYI